MLRYLGTGSEGVVGVSGRGSVVNGGGFSLILVVVFERCWLRICILGSGSRCDETCDDVLLFLGCPSSWWRGGGGRGWCMP